MTIEVGKFPFQSQLPALLYDTFMTIIRTGAQRALVPETEDQPGSPRAEP
ncbi:hypothetical protein L905_06770 [Agrobacterium sp. TS43]|nr:hypothetical protein L905_06770 [Agrobacterium sp. TS43]